MDNCCIKTAQNTTEEQSMARYGADEQRYAQAGEYPGLCLCRVLSRTRDIYRLATPKGERAGTVAGRFRLSAGRGEEYPAVGDFVMAALPEREGDGVIQAVLPRKSQFTRPDPGNARETQVVAANVDTLFLCMALGGNYNVSRLERYLAVAWNSGAVPVVVLTKADLARDTATPLAEIGAAAPGARVLCVSGLNQEGAAALLPWLTPGKTASFIGSSGVGKSTLINALAGKEVMTTSAVRAGDEKGRHTTTRRELILLPGGGMVIDTPGMRELGVDAVDLEHTFADIEELATRCRFSDCTHTAEPGCAVVAAVEAGALDLRRLESFRKLRREARYTGLDARRREAEKLNTMFAGAGGMKGIRKYHRENDKRKK